jgi:ParB family chromosome partitioning protein
MDPDELASLTASIRDRGQQMPVEVVALADGRYGLVSGARRLAALTTLRDENGEPRFATVKALLRPFNAAPEAYLAMVEENEIRADLSFYERGRLAYEAARLGVFDTPAAAVKMLFQHAPAPKRSKILSFVALHEALGNDLRFPEAIPEKLGLALVKAIQDNAEMTARLRDLLRGERADTASDERRVLEAVLRPEAGEVSQDMMRDIKMDTGAGVSMKARPGRVVIAGKGVTEALIAELAQWLESRQ